jgi:pimeloyl-ACP methyl ester carboxylesterase
LNRAVPPNEPTRRINLLLLPGLLCDATIWAAQHEQLADVATTWAPDYRWADTLETMAQAALDVVPGPLAVAGHSMGARVALEVWRAAPERVTRLALFDFGVDPVADGEGQSRRTLTDLSASSGTNALVDTWLVSMVHPDRHDEPGLMEPLADMVRSYTPDEHAGQISALLNRRDLRPLLPSITVPTLVAVGRQDPWRSIEHHREIAAAIPGARLEIIDDSGHMAPAERPAAVTALLRSWLHW